MLIKINIQLIFVIIKAMENNQSIFKYSSYIIFFIIFLSLVWSVLYFYESSKPSSQETFEKKHPVMSAIAHQFDPISREHFKLRKIATQSLDFPSSYKHLETIYFRNEKKKEIIIKTRFRGLDMYYIDNRACLRATYSYYGEEIMAPEFCDLKS